MQTFRVKKFSTISLQKGSQKKHYKSQQKKFKNKSLYDFKNFMQITSLKINQIILKQNLTRTVQLPKSHATSRSSHKQKPKQMQRQIYTARTGSQKIQGTPSHINKMNRKNRMAFRRNRQKFTTQYGYIFNKNKNNTNPATEIRVQQTLGQPTQRLLSGVQSMKIQKILQNRPTTTQVNRSRKQKQNLNRIINEIQQSSFHPTEIQGSARQKQLAKIRSLFQPQMTKKHNLNVKNLVNHLIKNSNKIYGKHHIADSVTWCQDVLSMQIEDQYNNQQDQQNQYEKYEKYKNFLERLQRQRLKKRKTEQSHKIRTIQPTQSTQNRAKIVFQLPFSCRKMQEQQKQS